MRGLYVDEDGALRIDSPRVLETDEWSVAMLSAIEAGREVAWANAPMALEVMLETSEDGEEWTQSGPSFLVRPRQPETDPLELLTS